MEALKFKELEHAGIEKVEQLFRDRPWRSLRYFVGYAAPSAGLTGSPHTGDKIAWIFARSRALVRI